MTDTTRLADTEVKEFVDRWYQLLDTHAPVEQLLPLLADDELEMRLPETTTHGHAGFKQWYDTVVNRFFDEVHALKELAVDTGGDEARVRLVVNWQAKIWNPPAAKSEWIGFDAGQTWTMRRSATTGRPEILLYSVDSFVPMEGSATL